MEQFQKVVITTKGQALMAKMMATAGNIRFTKISTSSQTYVEAELEGLTGLEDVRQTTLVSRITRVNNTAIKIEGIINNVSLTTGYFYQTLGVYAVDPQEGEILYGVTIVDNQANWIPPFNNTTSTVIRFELDVNVGTAANVTLQIDPAAVASVDDLDGIYSQIADFQSFIGYTEDDIFGIEADFKNIRFTRLAGATYRKAGAGFDNINAFGGRRRCIVADDGAILAYNGDAAYTETGKLLQSVTVGGTTYDVGTSSQVMVYQPKFYYRMVPLELEKIPETVGYHIRKARYYVSDTPKNGFKVHPAFIKNKTERPFVLIGAYDGCLQQGTNYNLTDEQNGDFTVGTGDKLSSIANAKPLTGRKQDLTRRNCGIVAENRGENWSQEYAAITAATQLLMVIEYCTFDTQSALGLGAVGKTDDGASNLSENTGLTAPLGNVSGMTKGTNGLDFVSYRGQENPWGNVWKYVDGINLWGDGTVRGGIPFIADNNFVEDKNTDNYQSAGFSLSNTWGYISAFGYGNPDFDWLFMPSEAIGSGDLINGELAGLLAKEITESNIHEILKIFPDLNGYRTALLGARWSYERAAGAFCLAMDDVALFHSRTIGGRLVYVPPVSEGGL